MVVQIVTKENILPTAPTPHSLKKFKLSVLDQTQVKLYVPLMLFYLNNNTGNLNSVISDKSKLLKQSLSDTLTRFYPFAGKVRDDFYIDCNDEGVYYIETRVNCSLSDFLGQSPGDAMINSCGGIALCTCISHKLLDGATYSLFLKDWTSAARGSSSEIVNPSFIDPAFFPQIPSLFESTLFEVIAALLWKCVAKAACKSNKSSLGDPLNMGLSSELEHKTLVDQIKKCKAETSDDFIEAIKGDSGTPTLVKIAEMMTSGETTFSLWITSMFNMGLYELDFGWAGETCLVLLLQFKIGVCEAGTGSGIQAVVSVSEQEMAIFENDPELLAFASVNPVPL
ncbi:hypothetical protein POM88_011223 [Heracleum sosnowskyi]|uniref:Transferase n=1 Tax=Heracleum sosnowskyi TaxID=360622 RepID=A0AAD8IU43_9APIA|nr:hypothetical protein POM88_011223 [Heracleum sosnowskyi]